MKRAITVFLVTGVLSFVLGLFGLRDLILPMLCITMVMIGLMYRLASNLPEIKATSAERTAALMNFRDPEQVTVYLYRDAFVGRAVGLPVSLDGTYLLQLRSPRFTMVRVSPGIHTVSAKIGSDNPSVTFEAAAGETVIFRLAMKGLFDRGAKLIAREPNVAGELAKLTSITMLKAK